MKNILLVDKSKGITSYDVIRALKRKYPGVKLGHAGTLDPMATGLLIVGVGEGTKTLNALLKLPKTYAAEILLGSRTDTADVTGKTIETKRVPKLDRKAVSRVLESLVGMQMLTVPKYSAVKVHGKRLYEYARSGERVKLPLRAMVVRNATLESFKGSVIACTLHVESGVYVRSIAEELGRRLGTVATLQALRRTAIGDFRVEDAVTIGELTTKQLTTNHK